MSEYLHYSEFVPYAPTGLGEEVNIHHCKQGKNNDRLYIRRNYDNSVVAYCHHCGKRGISKHDGVRNISTFRTHQDLKIPRKQKELKLPPDFESDINKWPVKAKAWPMKYGITKDEINANHMGYSEYFGRVVLPCFDEEGKLSCYQTRRIEGITGKSTFIRDTKYDTFIKQDSTIFQRLFRPKFTGICPANYPTDTLCIVEDNLSAIKCNKVVPTIALNGTSLDKESIIKLNNTYNNYIIFLDNDNSQVKRSQTKLKRNLELIAKGTVTIIYQHKDPKEFTMEELKSILL